MTGGGNLDINRGVELLLRRRGKPKPEKPKTFQFNFGKMVSLFKREMHVYLEFSIDIKKRKSLGG